MKNFYLLGFICGLILSFLFDVFNVVIPSYVFLLIMFFIILLIPLADFYEGLESVRRKENTS